MYMLFFGCFGVRVSAFDTSNVHTLKHMHVYVREKVHASRRFSCECSRLSHSVGLSPLCALPPNASIHDPLQWLQIAVETALKEKIRIASSLI